MSCPHSKYDVTKMDPHERARYESAMRHVEAAKAAGKSTDECHAIFQTIMNRKWDDPVPNDAERVERAKKARDNGAGCKEIAAILHGEK